MDYPLQDKVVLVTGASAGIGEAIAIEAARQKAKVVLAARREGVLQNVARLVESKGGKALVVPTDMTQPEQIANLAETVLKTWGQVDVLVNNAGYGQMGPIELVDDAAVRRQFEVNVFSLLDLTRRLVPAMRARKSGRIINISSIAGKVSLPFMGIYNASKHALEAISDSLRLELAPFGIKVVVIEPGPVATDFFYTAETVTKDVLADKADNPYQSSLEAMGETMSVGSIAWTAERIASVVVTAMTATQPRDRYVAASGGAFGLGLLQAMPTHLSDKLLSGMFKLDQLGSEP